MVVKVFLFLGFSRVLRIFLGRALKVVLVGVKIVKGLLFFSVEVNLVVFRVLIKVFIFLLLEVIFMMFLVGVGLL